MNPHRPIPVHETPATHRAHLPWTALVAWLIGPGFATVAAYFIFVAPPADIPTTSRPLVSTEFLGPTRRRTPMGALPTIQSGGFQMRCMECHRFFDSPPIERRTLTQHTAIVLTHGLNNRCFNCHDRKNRERLVLHDGSTIGYTEVPTLCSQCHGTVFRDWQRGTHGKTLGSWKADAEARRRLECVECHDPHAPAYPKLAPLPAPETLRMGDQSEREPEPEHHHHPLERHPASPSPKEVHP